MDELIFWLILHLLFCLGSLKQKRPNEVEHSNKAARTELSKQLSIDCMLVLLSFGCLCSTILQIVLTVFQFCIEVDFSDVHNSLLV